MCDTYLYEQGMFFWIEDMSEGTTNTVIPKKKRIWLIVSNNTVNKTSSNLTVVPVYTRDEATKNTHVAFKNGDRNCVIVCEDIMSVPRYRIHPSNFAGICSNELWTKVHKAILNQFEDEVTIKNVSETVTSLITNEEFKNTIVDAVINLYKKDKEPVIAPTKNIEVVNTEESTVKGKVGRKPNAKLMNLEISKKYYEDANVMTLEELNNKYAEYGVVDDIKALSRRKAYIHAKLRKLGVALT